MLNFLKGIRNLIVACTLAAMLVLVFIAVSISQLFVKDKPKDTETNKAAIVTEVEIDASTTEASK